MEHRHEELLRRVTLGEVDPDAPEVVAARHSDAAFDRALGETRHVLERLEAARAEQDAILDDAARREGAPGEDAVAGFVRSRLEGTGVGRFRRNLGLALAASLVVAVVLPIALRRDRPTPVDPETPLGTTDGFSGAPAGEQADFGRFTWTAPASGGWFEVHVFDVHGRPVEGGESGRVEGNEWIPDPDRVRAWPGAVEWELRWYGTGGSLEDSASFSASRGRRPEEPEESEESAEHAEPAESVAPEEDAAAAQAFTERVGEAVRIHAAEGSPTAAEPHYRAALELAADLDAETRREQAAWLAIAHNGIGEALLARGEVLEGVRAIEGAERELEGLPDVYRSMLLSLLGELLIELGLPGRADEPIARALALARPVPGVSPNYGVLFNAHVRRIRQYLAVGRSRDAAEAVETCRRDYPWEAARAKIGEGRYARNRGTLSVLGGTAWMDLALDAEPDAAERAVEAFEEVGEGCRPIDCYTAEGRLAHLELRGGSVEAATARLADLRARTSAGEFGTLSAKELAWLASLEARAAELSGGGTADARARLGAAFADLLESWRGSVTPGGTGIQRYGRARLVLEQLVALASEEEALGAAIESAACGVLWEALGRPVPEVEEARAALAGESVACLVVVLGADRSFLLAFDDALTLRRELGSPRELSFHARELMHALRQAPAELSAGARRRREADLADHGGELGRALLPSDLHGWLAGKSHVRIVGAEDLEGLAFEVLPFGEETLGCSHAISYLPSLPVGVALARRRDDRGAPEEGVRLIAAPALRDDVLGRFPSLTPFDLSPDDLAPVREAFGAGEDDVWRGARATVAALATARENGVGAVHLIAHGVQDRTRELRPVVLLTPDGRSPTGELGVDLVRALEIPDLVVLSSCRAGRGPDRIGDAGAAHLGGAFLQAGASCVVLSGEDLRLGAALAFAEHFHRGHRGGASVGEALRLGRVALRRSAHDDPYYWSPLRAYGLDAAGD